VAAFTWPTDLTYPVDPGEPIAAHCEGGQVVGLGEEQVEAAGGGPLGGDVQHVAAVLIVLRVQHQDVQRGGGPHYARQVAVYAVELPIAVAQTRLRVTHAAAGAVGVLCGGDKQKAYSAPTNPESADNDTRHAPLMALLVCTSLTLHETL
jgi:hypothetical protein